MPRAAGGPHLSRRRPLADEKAAVGSALGGLDDRERLARGGVERMAFDRSEREVPSLRGTCLGQHLPVDLQHRIRLSHDLHPPDWIVHEGVDGKEGEDGARRSGGVHPVQPDEAPGHRARGDFGAGKLRSTSARSSPCPIAASTHSASAPSTGRSP